MKVCALYGVFAAAWPLGLAGLLDKVKAAAAGGNKAVQAAADRGIQDGGSANGQQLVAAGDSGVPACAQSSVVKKLLEVAHCWNIQRNYKALCKPDPGIPGMAVLNGMRVMAIMVGARCSRPDG